MTKNDWTDLFPITIVTERYGGGYCGGRYLAFNMEPELIPKVIYDGGDVEMMNYWVSGGTVGYGCNARNHDDDVKLIGIGSTPNEALDDLGKKLKRITSIGLAGLKGDEG